MTENLLGNSRNYWALFIKVKKSRLQNLEFRRYDYNLKYCLLKILTVDGQATNLFSNFAASGERD